MTKHNKVYYQLLAARSEAAFLLGWIRAIEAFNRKLEHLKDRYPNQSDTLDFAMRENKLEIQELHEERAYWLDKLDVITDES